jgi:flagellar biosynthesis protein FliP
VATPTDPTCTAPLRQQQLRPVRWIARLFVRLILTIVALIAWPAPSAAQASPEPDSAETDSGLPAGAALIDEFGQLVIPEIIGAPQGVAGGPITEGSSDQPLIAVSTNEIPQIEVPGVGLTVDSTDSGLSRSVLIVLLLTIGAVAPPILLLRTSFTRFIIGFVIFVPFLVIDLVVSSNLMSMGMVMLPPVFISLPVKLLLFVLVDGWGLIVGTLVASVIGP